VCSVEFQARPTTGFYPKIGASSMMSSATSADLGRRDTGGIVASRQCPRQVNVPVMSSGDQQGAPSLS